MAVAEEAAPLASGDAAAPEQQSKPSEAYWTVAAPESPSSAPQAAATQEDYWSPEPLAAGTQQPPAVHSISGADPQYTAGKPAGLITPGNININDRPIVANPYEGGNPSTVYSSSIEEDGKHILIPRVSDGADGKPPHVMSPREAIDYYHKTRQHLGIFDSEASADAYGADTLHNQQSTLANKNGRTYLEPVPLTPQAAARPLVPGLAAQMPPMRTQQNPLLAAPPPPVLPNPNDPNTAANAELAREARQRTGMRLAPKPAAAPQTLAEQTQQTLAAPHLQPTAGDEPAVVAGPPTPRELAARTPMKFDTSPLALVGNALPSRTPEVNKAVAAQVREDLGNIPFHVLRAMSMTQDEAQAVMAKRRGALPKGFDGDTPEAVAARARTIELDRSMGSSDEEIRQFLEQPALHLTDNPTFQKTFDPESDNPISRAFTGSAKVVEGLTTPTNIGLLLTMPEGSIGRMAGVYFTGQMLYGGAKDGYETVKKVMGRDLGGASESGVEALANLALGSLGAAHTMHGGASAGLATPADRPVGPMEEHTASSSRSVGDEAPAEPAEPVADSSRTFTGAANADAMAARRGAVPAEVQETPGKATGIPEPPSKDLAALAGEATNRPQPVGGTEPETGRDVLHPTDNPAALDHAAQVAAPELERRLGTALQGVAGARLEAVRERKSSDRLVEKLTQEGQPAETIPDYLASRVVADSPAGRDAAVAAIRREFPVVREQDDFKDGDKEYGYRAHKLQVQMPSGVSAEVHIVPREVAEVNADEHENYKSGREAELRGDKGAADAAAAEAKAKNDAAMEKFNARNGVEEKNSEKKGDRGESPEQASAAGETSSAAPANPKIAKGQAVLLYGHAEAPDGTPATIAYWNERARFPAKGEAGMQAAGRATAHLPGGGEKYLASVKAAQVQPIAPVRAPQPETGTAAERVMTAAVTQRGPEMVQQYLAEHTKAGETYLANDEIKNLFAEYKADRTAHNRDADGPASALKAAVLDTILSRPPSEGQSLAVVAMGTPASGKTTASVGGMGGATGLTLETIPDNLKTARALIDRLIAAGRQPVVSVNWLRDPAMNAARMLERARQMGRTVPIQYMAKAFVEQPRIAAELQRIYGDRIRIRSVDNSGEPGQAVLSDDLTPMLDATQAYTEGEALEAMRGRLEAENAAGEVSEAIYREARHGLEGGGEGVAGEPGKRQPGGGDRRGDAAELAEQRRQGDQLDAAANSTQDMHGISAERAQLGEGFVSEHRESAAVSEPGASDVGDRSGGGTSRLVGTDRGDATQRHGSAEDISRSQRLREDAEAEVPPVAYPPGFVGRIPLDELHVDPKRFQYKMNTDSGGATNKLRDVQWNDDLAASIVTWRDPDDGRIYVINGHHRYELARRGGARDMAVKMLGAEVKTAAEARAIGAKQGIAIAKAADTPAQQEELLRAIRQAEAKGKPVTGAALDELARQVQMAGEHKTDTMDLFGGGERTVGLALQVADVSAYVRKQILNEKRLFGGLTNAAKAKVLEAQDNQIQTGKNKAVAERAAQAAELYDRLSARQGKVYDVLRKAAEEISDGKSEREAKAGAYQRVRAELAETVSGAAKDGGSGVPAAEPGGPGDKVRAVDPVKAAKPSAGDVVRRLRPQGIEVATGAEMEGKANETPPWDEEQDDTSGGHKRPLFSRPKTDSAEFKRWFGDSKAVDEDGKPLVVYHGTVADFDTFDPERGGTRQIADTGDFGQALYFSERAQTAHAYAHTPETYERPNQFLNHEGESEGAKIVPVFLRAENPLVLNTPADFEKMRALAGSDENWYALLADEQSTLIRDAGYDSVHDKDYNQWAVFDPKQVKSAIGNSGAFDPENPSILAKRGTGDASEEDAGLERGRYFAIPADGADAPAVMVDGPMRATLNALEQDLADAGRWEAVAVPKSIVDKMVEKLRLKTAELRANGSRAAAATAERLAGMLERSRDRGGNTILVTPEAAERAMGEEQFHGWQMRQGTDLGDVVFQMGQHPAALKAREFLKRKGYGDSITEAVHEATAKTFNGDWRGAGLTKDEGASLLREFLDAVVKVRGPEALDDLPKIKAEIAEMLGDGLLPAREAGERDGQDKGAGRGRGGEAADAGGAGAAGEGGAGKPGEQGRLFKELRAKRGAGGGGVRGREDAGGAGEEHPGGADEKPARPLEVGADRRLQFKRVEESKEEETVERTPLDRLIDQVGDLPKNKRGPKEWAAHEIDVTAQNYRDVGERALDAVRQGRSNAARMWDWLRRPAKWTDYKDAKGDFLLSESKQSQKLLDFADYIRDVAPDKTQRSGITIYNEANGDRATLRDWAAQVNPDHREAFEAALQLTPDEVKLATAIRDFHAEMAEEGKRAGLFPHPRQAYMMHLFEPGGPSGDKVLAEILFHEIEPNPSITKPRTYPSYFEAIQAGETPKDLDAAYLTSAYAETYARALASRTFLRRLLEGGRAEDGRPLGILNKHGGYVQVDPQNDPYIIAGQKLPEDISSYRFLDHPATRNWLWELTDKDAEEINPKLFEDKSKGLAVHGDIYLHPEIYDDVRKMLKTSAVRRSKVGRAALNISGTLKQSLLSLSGFHQVQETVHALEHKVNPLEKEFRNFKLDLDDAKQASLVKHGLVVSMFDGQEEFSDGQGRTPLKYIPGAGQLLSKYQTWLFRDYIPKLKMQLALHAYDRNLLRYEKKLYEAAKKDLQGNNARWGKSRDTRAKLTAEEIEKSARQQARDQAAEITAQQANSAFGGINWRMMGADPTLVDLSRLALLAPDFLYARASFVGQALKGFGGEQRVALLRGAMVMYTVARLGNYLLSSPDEGDWKERAKLDPADAFKIVYKGKHYGLRTVQGDVLELATDPRAFAAHRLNPMTTRPLLELVTGRDEFGRQRSVTHMAEDYGKSVLPIPIQNRVKLTETDWGDTLASFLGYQTGKYRSPAEQLAHKLHLQNIPDRPDDDDAEKAQESRTKVRMENELRSGKISSTDVWNAVSDDKLSAGEARRLTENAARTPLDNDVNSIGLEAALKVYEKATPLERTALQPILEQKRANLSRNTEMTPEQKEKLEARAEAILTPDAQ